MVSEIKSNRFIIISALIIAAALTRFIPHLPNFTAIGALALFAGSKVQDKKLALLVPVFAMMVSDLLIPGGFNLFVYACFVATVFMGMLIKNYNPAKIAFGGLLSAVLFFLVTNFAFLYPTAYPQNFQGIMASYVAGIPFFNYQLLGNLFYSALLFGSFYFIEHRLILKHIKK